MFVYVVVKQYEGPELGPYERFKSAHNDEGKWFGLMALVWVPQKLTLR